MIAVEDGPGDIFHRFRGLVTRKFKPVTRQNETRQHWLATGVSCPLCISFWLSFGIAAFYYQSPVQYVLLALALSGVTVILVRFLG